MVAILLTAKDVSDVPFQHWTYDQAMKLFNDSPWVQVLSFTTKSMGSSGRINESRHRFVVRLFSARPIREAYVRILQLMNNYDNLPAGRRQAFEDQINRLGFLNDEAVKDDVVIAVDYKPSDPNAGRDLKRFLETASIETLGQSVFLDTAAGRVGVKRYIPPGKEGLSMARFIFPRELNGRPIVAAHDKEIRFELSVLPIGQKLLVGFRCAKLIYKGALAF